MADFEGLFKGTKRKTVRATVCLRGDLVAQYAALEAELAAARLRDAEAFNGGEARAIADRMNGLRDEMTAAEVTLESVALPPMRPLDLLMEHPPRDDNKSDAALGYNQATYYPALIRESCANVISNDGVIAAADTISVDAWDTMLAGLGHSDFDTLVGAAMEANGRTSVPFSRLASLVSQTNEASSTPPKRGTSPRSGSKAGNPVSKRSSSTTAPEDSPAL